MNNIQKSVYYMDHTIWYQKPRGCIDKLSSASVFSFDFSRFYLGPNHRKIYPARIGLTKYSHPYTWYNHGLKHRLDGPAYIDSVHTEYYITGVQYSEEEFNEEIKRRTKYENSLGYKIRLSLLRFWRKLLMGKYI